MPPFVGYHGLTGQEHQQRVDTLAPQGYRPISLSVSGDGGDARYAAAWVQRPGPAWWAVHNLSAEAYQSKFNELVGQGYAPVLVSASGPAASATFTALFEQGVTRPWFARHGLRWDPDTNPDTITHENNRAFGEGYIPRSLSVYGTPADRRFAGVWIKNDAPTPWSWWFADAGTYQRIFDAENQADVRPGWVSVAPDTWQLAVFRDDHVGAWAARHGITGDEYQGEFDVRVANGMMPVVVQAGGGGSARRYSSIFAATDVPLPKRWTVTGTTIPQLAGLDEEVRGFMSAHAIRAGALAVVRGAEMLVSRGYTWAEDGYAVTQPNARFRLASVSKAFAAAAITRLVAMGRLAWNTQAYPFLGITSALLPDQTPDPAVNTITVDHLVNRRSGLTHARVTENGVVRTFEPSADLRTVAARLGRTTTPTRDDLVRYMYGEAPDFPPGSQQAYSNFAFTLLTSIVERASGRGFLDFLRADVLAPQGLSEVWVGATELAGRLPNEVRYDNPGVGLTVLQPTTNTYVPNVYGTFALENSEGTGGLVSTAPTVARFITQHAVWDAGPRIVATRHGTFDGMTSGARSRPDNLDFAYMFNRRVTDAEHDGITNAIDGYLTSHPV